MAGINFTDEREYAPKLTFKNNDTIHNVTKRCCENCKHFKTISDNNFDSDDVGYLCDKGKFDGYSGEGAYTENECELFNAL